MLYLYEQVVNGKHDPGEPLKHFYPKVLVVFSQVVVSAVTDE